MWNGKICGMEKFPTCLHSLSLVACTYHTLVISSQSTIQSQPTHIISSVSITFDALQAVSQPIPYSIFLISWIMANLRIMNYICSFFVALCSDPNHTQQKDMQNSQKILILDEMNLFSVSTRGLDWNIFFSFLLLVLGVIRFCELFFFFFIIPASSSQSQIT